VAALGRAQVVTVSDRSHAGVREDSSGPLLAALLVALGLEVAPVLVVPDEVVAISEAVRAGAASHELVVTTGGTGLSPRDVTPEAVRPLLDREIPGLGEALRQQGRDLLPTTILSRSLAGSIGRTLVVTLPGSTGGVRDGVRVLAPVLAHALAQLRGGDH